MKLLLIHRAFPGQFKHLIGPLKSRGDHIVALGDSSLESEILHDLVDTFVGYKIKKGNTPNIPNGLLDIESKVIRGIAAAEAMQPFKNKGYQPHIILTHSGWGESMFLQHLFPEVPQVHYLEYFYGSNDGDMNFNDELLGRKNYQKNSWEINSIAQIKSMPMLSSLENMRWGISPTEFQRSQFPKRIQEKCSIIHDGIDTDFAKPKANIKLMLPNGKSLSSNDQLITFVSRTFEPYRGIHSFLRALVEVQKKNPRVQTVLVGKDTPFVSYGSHREDGQGWLSFLKKDLGKDLDWERIHSLGSVKHSLLINLFQISSVHIYLTYPFVLSWSVLEAMSCGCIVIGSETKPVQEIIRNGENGFLEKFGDYLSISQKILDILKDKKKYSYICKNARSTILKKYELKSCVNARLKIIDDITASNFVMNQIG